MLLLTAILKSMVKRFRFQDVMFQDWFKPILTEKDLKQVKIKGHL